MPVPIIMPLMALKVVLLGARRSPMMLLLILRAKAVVAPVLTLIPATVPLNDGPAPTGVFDRLPILLPLMVNVDPAKMEPAVMAATPAVPEGVEPMKPMNLLLVIVAGTPVTL